MSGFSLNEKVRDTLILIYGAIVYNVAMISILLVLYNNIDFACQDAWNIFSIFVLINIPLIGILVIRWGYGLKLNMPGIDLEYYPVEKIAQKPVTINQSSTIEDADQVMTNEGIDFLNIIDKLGNFIGIITKSDLFNAKKRGTMKSLVTEFMTPKNNVIYAIQDESLLSIMEKIGKHKHSRLPLIDSNGMLRGIIDAVDIQDLIAKNLLK